MVGLGDLLPPSVAVRTSSGEREPERPLPEEEAIVAAAVPARRREFAAVRQCAHAALRSLGRDAGPILHGPRGEPLWPRGVAGSMTHCAGLAAAAVTTDPKILSIGIDAEVRALLPRGVLEQVATAKERAMLARLAAVRPDVPWDRLLFSAKESVYKCWYPLLGRSLGFDGATIAFSPDGAIFRVDASTDVRATALLARTRTVGRAGLNRTHVMTTVLASPV